MTIHNQTLQFTITQLANSETIERNFALGLTALANQTDANDIKLSLVSDDSLTKLENVTATAAQLNRLASISSADAIFTSSTVNIRDNNISLGTINLNKLVDISPNSILANSNAAADSPSAITVNPSTLVGRTNNGVIASLTVDQITVLLNSDISEKITNTKLNIASAQQASDGVSNDVLMTPVRVKSVIDSLSYGYSDLESINGNTILGNNSGLTGTARQIAIPQNTVLGRRNNNIEPLNVDNLTQLLNNDTNTKISNSKLNIATSAEATSGTSNNLMTASRTQELFDASVADLTSGDGRNIDYELVRSVNVDFPNAYRTIDTGYDIPNDANDFQYVFVFKRGSHKEFSPPIRGSEILNLFTVNNSSTSLNVSTGDADGNQILVIEIGTGGSNPSSNSASLLFARTNANDLLVGSTSNLLDPMPLEIWRIPLVSALPPDAQTNMTPENRLIPNEGNENFVLTKTSDTDFDVDWAPIPQANQAQAEDGTNDNVFMTPLRTAQAIAELAVTDAITDIPTASQAEAEDGTLNNVYMTPLRTLQAIEDNVEVGITTIPTATQAQAEGGTANDVYMTPIRTAQAIEELVQDFAIDDIPIATQAQAELGTSTDTFMTPQRTLQAINEFAITELPDTPDVPEFILATQAQAETATDNVSVMTPLRTRQTIERLRGHRDITTGFDRPEDNLSITETNVPISTTWNAFDADFSSVNISAFDWLFIISISNIVNGNPDGIPAHTVFVDGESLLRIFGAVNGSAVGTSLRTRSNLITATLFNKASAAQEFRDGVQIYLARTGNGNRLALAHTNAGNYTNNFNVQAVRQNKFNSVN